MPQWINKMECRNDLRPERQLFSSPRQKNPASPVGDSIRRKNILARQTLPMNPDAVLAVFFQFYKTPGGFHPRNIRFMME